MQTRFELSEVLSAKILTAIREVLGPETEVVFDTSEQLINGIELSTQGHKLAWSITDYLSSIEKSLDELLKKPDTLEKSDTPEEPDSEEKLDKAETEEASHHA